VYFSDLRRRIPLKIKSIIIPFLSSFALLMVPAFASMASAQCVTAPTGMTNWWTADGNAQDIIGGQHGTQQGGATFDNGKVQQAFSLDGSNDHISVANNPSAAFNFTGSFSVDAWIYLKSPSTQFAPIVSKWNDIGGNQRGYFLAVENNAGLRLRFDVSGDGLFLGSHSAIVYSVNLIPLNTWVHVAGVYDQTAGTMKVYVNGVGSAIQFGAVPATPFVNNEPVLIGAGDLGSDVRDFFNGLIDEVELFNRPLTQADVTSLVNAGSAGKTIPVVIDIKPDGTPNPINLGSKGVVPVAILSTDVFDATTVNPSTLSLAASAVNIKGNGSPQSSFEDVNGDSRPDVVAHFPTQSLGLTKTSTSATLTGKTFSGRCIAGTDSVKIVP
jgi:hypothetical protein